MSTPEMEVLSHSERTFLPMERGTYRDEATSLQIGDVVLNRTVTVHSDRLWNGQPFVTVERTWLGPKEA